MSISIRGVPQFNGITGLVNKGAKMFGAKGNPEDEQGQQQGGFDLMGFLDSYKGKNPVSSAGSGLGSGMGGGSAMSGVSNIGGGEGGNNLKGIMEIISSFYG